VRKTRVVLFVLFGLLAANVASSVDKIDPIVGCPQDPTLHTIKSDGVGYGDTKGKALDAARAQADAKSALMPACPSKCRGTATEVDPSYDSSTPTYTPFGSGYECKVERTRTVTLACKLG
jgi:hypothetical protein